MFVRHPMRMMRSFLAVLALMALMGPGCDESMIFIDEDDGSTTTQGDSSTTGQTDGAKTPGSEGYVPGNDGSTANKDYMPPLPPTGKEVCGNGLDDDGDGLVDEGCGCKIGTTQPCYPLPKAFTVGICKMGSQLCDGTVEFGKWEACTGAILPQAEICGDGIDQNCDGADMVCPPKCGDGKCNGTETCATCPQDCGACAPFCGDGKCNGTEDCTTCPGDCGACPTQCDTFTFGVSARAVDIVFIVDQSGSMSTEIAMVKSNLNSFSTYINGTKLDYHVIMLAKRGTSTYDICIPPPLGGANCADGTRYKQVDQTVGSTNELTLFQSKITDIESFMRAKSLRQIVVITDDNSSLSASSFHTWVKARTDWSDYIFHTVASLVTTSGCTASIGKVYMDLSSWTSGYQTDLCKANWSTLFQQLGQSVAGIAIKQYALTKTPLNSKVDVSYGSTKKTQGTDYDYDSTKNQIELKGTLPTDGTSITACYQYKP